MKRVVVVGGGIAGLATALRIRDAADAAGPPVEVLVLEAGDRVGGNIRTERVPAADGAADGAGEGAGEWVVENGPNGFLDNVPAMLRLVDRVGLRDQLRRADEAAARRFIFRGDRLHPVPTGPIGFLRSGLLSVPGRLRVFAEPFIPGRTDHTGESVRDFAARRIGAEAADVLVDAMVSGVFAGDVRALSLPAAFPKMAAMEAEHGGLVRAMIGRMKARRAAKREAGERRARGEDVEELTRPGGPAGPGGTLTSFAGGLDALPRALAAELGDAVRLSAPVEAITRGEGPGQAAAGHWTVRLRDGESIAADAVVLAIPSARAAPLLEPVDPDLAAEVAGIDTAGLAVVALGYRAGDIDADGFGFLVPRGESPRILGCLWDSSIFPGRAPDGRVLVRAMIGGAHDPAAATEDEDDLVTRVRADLELAMGVRADPVLVRVYRWPLGIAQYHVGHLERLDRIRTRLGRLTGLHLTGSSYGGVSMNACVEAAESLGDAVIETL